MLNVLPEVVTETQNVELQRIPTIKEVRRAVIGLNRKNVGGTDGLTGIFFQDS